MIELKNDQLIFSFPDVHPEARCEIGFQRTLRIPDDNNHYPLPAGLGRFPLAHVDDLGERLPQHWQKHGGVYLPMYQSEALWIDFQSDYYFAVKIAAGKINALTGESWSNQLDFARQDYLVIPDQPWLDGYCVQAGLIRQFVAMPLGEGYSAEEQLTGQAQYGGLQIMVYPMKADYYREHFEKPYTTVEHIMFSRSASVREENHDMGLAPGGLMRQKIEEDEYGETAWDTSVCSRCFVHITNSESYQRLTGRRPPGKPLSIRDYAAQNIPWFEYYSEGKGLKGSRLLAGLGRLASRWRKKTGAALPGSDTVYPGNVKKLRPDQVREGEF